MSDRLQIEDRRIRAIAEKVEAGERLSFDDGVALYRSSDLLSVGALANQVRERMHGNRCYFNINRHINPTNVCVAHCKLCAFGRDPGAEGAYTMSIEEVVETAGKDWTEAVSELHIVGGLHPDLPFEYYLDLLRALKKKFPPVHLKAFTMVEIHYFSWLTKLSIEKVLKQLKKAGLDSCPGGGAEIFHPRARRIICDHKISGQMWLSAAKKAHELGIKSNATMLYGHIETDEERVDHLVKLRELQDETGGFQCFIPLAFHPANTPLDHLPRTGGMDDLKNIAVSRLLLDNVPHIKAYWIMLTPEIAQVALRFGADDIDGTVVEEKIYHDAGATTSQVMTRNEILRLIREAGREPVERDTLYRPLKRTADGGFEVDTSLTVSV